MYKKYTYRSTLKFGLLALGQLETLYTQTLIQTLGQLETHYRHWYKHWDN